MNRLRSAARWLLAPLALAAGLTPGAAAQPTMILDLCEPETPMGECEAATPMDEITRIYGYTGDGTQGVPIAGGWDCDGDGFVDLALASVKADPIVPPEMEPRDGAGEIIVIFGDGTIGGTIDLDALVEAPSADILRIAGAHVLEVTGASVWMDDVTGDGLGDILIGRQNHTPAGRTGAGALSIVVGGEALGDLAASLAMEDPLGYLDLGTPPGDVMVLTIIGAAAADRLGIWVRTGDIDDDGVADIAVGADQVDGTGDNQGAVYVIRGGTHLATTETVDLADFGTMAFESTAVAGQVARIDPPASPAPMGYHLGATLQVADLDDNGRAEVLAGAALNRSSAAINPEGESTAQPVGGAPHGKLFIAWDDNFPDPPPWMNGYAVDLGAPPGRATSIQGSAGDPLNDKFGEEILGGLDYDGDGSLDLFVGDLTGDGGNGFHSGLGHVFYDAAQLKPGAPGLLAFALDDEPMPVTIRTTLVLGPRQGAIGIDTATHGDYDGDGIADLTACHPHDEPQGRHGAGSAHVLYGEAGGWPELVDLSPAGIPAGEVTRVVEIQGAHEAAGDTGDTLCYSAAWGDVDGDGRMDLLINEMAGNGLAEDTIDVGNYLVIAGPALLPRVLLDVDDNGTASPLSDGILILRHLFGFTVSGMEGAIGMGAERSAEEIETYLALTGAALDVDGNDSVGALTDGLLILRYLFGFEDDVLVDGALASDASRTDPAEIEAFLDRLMP